MHDMKKALKSRKHKGLTIAIILGDPGPMDDTGKKGAMPMLEPQDLEQEKMQQEKGE